MNKTKKNRRAFTLIELLVGIALSASVLIATYGVYMVSTKGFRQSTASAELTQNARISMERLSREIRQNIEILTPLPSDFTVGTPPSEIKFQDGHNYWPGIGKIQYITYKLEGTDLHRIVSHYAFEAAPDDWVLYSTLGSDGVSIPDEIFEPGSDQIKAQNITEIQFWGTKTITINLAVSNDIQTYHFETKALGRNIQ